jgi:hypothetical protein
MKPYQTISHETHLALVKVPLSNCLDICYIF